MNETRKPARGWRILRRILISLAILATLIALFYTEEDWRGKHDWEAYKHKWEAKGEKFDWQAFVPPAVPNDRNFFTAPIVTNILAGKIVMTPYGNDGGPHFPSPKDVPRDKIGYMGGRGGIVMGGYLQAWQYYYRHRTNTEAARYYPIAPQPQTPSKDVLLALSKYDSAVEELRQASERPYANIPLPYKRGFSATVSTLMPYLATLKQCCQVLQLRACAELADDQTAKALDDLKLSLRLNKSIRNSPFLIAHLIRMDMMSMTIASIWEGLADHRWSDEQLAALETELGNRDFLADYEFAMRGERAFAIAAIDNERRTRQIISIKPDRSGFITNKLFFVPSGFFYQNELADARMMQQWILPLVNTNSRVVSPGEMRRADVAIRAEIKHYSPYKTFAVMTVQALDTAAKGFAVVQTDVNLAMVACALERYRLAHGEYPETLDPLTPRFITKLPHDIINGRPLHYRRTDDGSFVLYSVGWNETDDGGKAALIKGGNLDKTKGDWVWCYPAK